MSKNYELIKDSGDGKKVHKLFRQVIGNWHEHLKDAKVVLVWRHGTWTSRGKVVLGKCKKASDFDTELAEYDFAIILNAGTWDELEPAQQLALLDHECCHATFEENSAGEIIWKTRGHDLEEFKPVVERHGMYMLDIEEFVAAAQKKPSLFDNVEAAG